MRGISESANVARFLQPYYTLRKFLKNFEWASCARNNVTGNKQDHLRVVSRNIKLPLIGTVNSRSPLEHAQNPAKQVRNTFKKGARRAICGKKSETRFQEETSATSKTAILEKSKLPTRQHRLAAETSNNKTAAAHPPLPGYYKVKKRYHKYKKPIFFSSRRCPFLTGHRPQTATPSDLSVHFDSKTAQRAAMIRHPGQIMINWGCYVYSHLHPIIAVKSCQTPLTPIST